MVARFITARRMGYEPADAVERVVLSRPAKPPMRTDADGAKYVIQATTFGPMFSKEIDAAARAVAERHGPQDARSRFSDYSREVIAAARAAGADVDGWVRWKMMQAVAGPVAEAKALGKEFDDMLGEAACAPDFGDALRAGEIAGWAEERISEEILNAADAVAHCFADTATWRALLKLAASLPGRGVVLGRRCWAIFSAALAQSAREARSP